MKLVYLPDHYHLLYPKLDDHRFIFLAALAALYLTLVSE